MYVVGGGDFYTGITITLATRITLTHALHVSILHIVLVGVKS